MKAKRKSRSKIYLLSLIWGIIYTSFILLAVGPKFIGSIIEDGSEFLTELQNSFATWFDPFAYFIVYVIGYAIIWWKPLWGSIIIILSSIFYVIMGGLNGPPIFAVPGFLVGAFYLIDWLLVRRNQTNTD